MCRSSALLFSGIPNRFCCFTNTAMLEKLALCLLSKREPRVLANNSTPHHASKWLYDEEALSEDMPKNNKITYIYEAQGETSINIFPRGGEDLI